MASAAFQHDLPRVDGEDEYYLKLWQQLEDQHASDEIRRAYANLTSLMTDRRSGDGPNSSGDSAASTSGFAAPTESDLVSLHVELVSKELYAAVSACPSLRSWTPSSAANILASTPIVLQPTKSYSGTQLPCYRVHDELARAAEIPPRRYVKPETWEHRQTTMREFLTPPRMAIASQIIDHVLSLRSSSTTASTAATTQTRRTSQAAASPPACCIQGYYQLAEDPRTFVHFGDGLFFHVWRNPYEARRFTSSGQKLWQTLFEHCLHPYGTQICAMLVIKGLAGTFIQMAPLLPTGQALPYNQDAENCAASAVTKCLGVLIGSSRLARGAAGTLGVKKVSFSSLPDPRLMLGADGRYYFMNPTAFGIIIEELELRSRRGHSSTPTETEPLLPPPPPRTPLRLDWYHQVLPRGTSYAYRREELLDALRLGPCNAAAETILKGALPKLPEMVMQQVVATTMHTMGINMRYLSLVLECMEERRSADSAQPRPTFLADTYQVAMDSIRAEMICRTVKALLRAEANVLATSSSPSSATECARHDPPTTTEAVIVDRVNRFMQWCSTGAPEIWNAQVLVALREKFQCPSGFDVPFHPRFFKILTWYLTPKYGAAYDAKANRYSRVTQGGNPNSTFFLVPDIVKMQLQAKASEESLLLMMQWWSASVALPSSTPLSWLERTIRMLRIATLAVIMKHQARNRFIGECTKAVLSSSSSWRLHRVVVALFTLMLSDEMDPTELVAHPLYSVVIEGLRPMMAESHQLAWLERAGDEGEAPRHAAAAASNCHFVGYVLRSLSSLSLAAGGRASASESSGILRNHVAHAAALQLRNHVRLLEEIGENGGALEAPLSGRAELLPIDVCCNAQLLLDLSALDDRRVECALVANLARYSRPMDGLWSIRDMSPQPTFIGVFHATLKQLWRKHVVAMARTRQTDDREGTNSAIDILFLGTCWTTLAATTVAYTETSSAHVGVGWDASPRASALTLEARYNDPQVACALVRLLANFLRCHPASGTSTATATSMSATQLSIVYDVEQLLAEAYPTVAVAGTSPKAFAESGDAFTVDATSAIHNILSSTAFATACGAAVSSAVVGQHHWRLAVLLSNLLQHSRFIPRTRTTDDVCLTVEQRSSRACVIQRLFRKLKSGSAFTQYPIGSPEWHEQVIRRLCQLDVQASLYALGIDMMHSQWFYRTQRHALTEEQLLRQWALFLEEEINRSSIEERRGAAERQTLCAAVVVNEETARWDSCVEEVTEGAELFLGLTFERYSQTLASIQSEQSAAVSSTLILEKEVALRWGLQRDELYERCFSVERELLTEMCLSESRRFGESMTAEIALESTVCHERTMRHDLERDALEVTALAIVSGSASLALAVLASIIELAEADTVLLRLQGRECAERRTLEALTAVELAVGGCEAWLTCVAAHQLLGEWLAVYVNNGGEFLVAQLIRPVMTSLLHEHERQLLSFQQQVQAAAAAAAIATMADDEARQRHQHECDELWTWSRLVTQGDTVLREQIARCSIRDHFDVETCVILPERQARREVVAREGSEFFEKAVMPQVETVLLAVSFEECREAEGLLRTHLELVTAMRRRQQFSRPFVLSFETTCDVPRREAAARIELMRAFGICDLQCHFAQRCRELRQLLALAEDRKRGILLSEEHLSRTRLTSSLQQAMHATVVGALHQREALQRQEWTRDYVLQSSELLAEAMKDFVGALTADEARERQPVLPLWEQVLRQGLCVSYARQISGLLVSFVRAHHAQLLTDCVSCVDILIRTAAILRRQLTKRSNLAAEETAEYEKLLLLEGMMRRIALNQFHAHYKSLLLPSQKAFLAFRRRKQRSLARQRLTEQQIPMPSSLSLQRVHASPSPPRAAVEDLLKHRLQLVVSLEATTRNHVEQSEENTWTTLCKGFEEPGSDLDAIQKALQTPPWDKGTYDDGLLCSPPEQFHSPIPQDPGSAAKSLLLFSPSSIDLVLSGELTSFSVANHRPPPPLPPPVEIPSAAPAAPVDWNKRTKALIARESVARESLEAWERGFWKELVADEATFFSTMREMVFLGPNKSMLGFLCFASAYYPTSSSSFMTSRGNNIKVLCTDARDFVRRLLETREVLYMDESKHRRRLMEHEQSSRASQDMSTTTPHNHRTTKPRLGVAVPTQNRKALPKEDPVRSAAPSTASPPNGRNVLQPLRPTVEGASSSILERSPPNSLRHSNSFDSAAVALAQEVNLLLDEWSSRQRRATAQCKHVDDLWATETRMRMRLEEIEAKMLLELLDKLVLHPAASLSSLASTLRTSFASLGRSPLQSTDNAPWSMSALSPSKTVSTSSAGLTPVKSSPSLNPVDPKGRRRM